MSKLYRKKPVVIEAMKFTEETKNQCFHFVTCNHYADFDENGSPIMRIQTFEGITIASLGDYIVKGIKGEFYPCKPDVFEGSHEPVEEVR